MQALRSGGAVAEATLAAQIQPTKPIYVDGDAKDVPVGPPPRTSLAQREAQDHKDVQV